MYLYAFITLIINLIVANLIWSSTSWYNYSIFFDGAFEFFSFLVSLLIFIIIWYTYERNKTAIHLLGFGFLIVAFLEIFHMFYNFWGNRNLSLEYLILLRLIEGIVLFLISIKSFSIKINKWIGLGYSLLIILCFYYLLLVFPLSQTILLNKNGTASIYNIFESFLIGLFLIGLYR